MAMTQLNVSVTDELARAIRICAAYHGVTIQDFAREVFLSAVTSDTAVTGALLDDMRARLTAGMPDKVDA